MDGLDVLYTPRILLDALKQIPAPVQFLKSQLIRRTRTHDTEFIQLDVEKGGRKLAAYVSRTGASNVVGKRGYDTVAHAIPYVSEQIDYTAKDVKVRMAGESPYGGMSPAARLNERVGQWLQDLRDRFSRLEEQQLAEAIQTGKVHVSGKDVDYEVDFQMDSDHIITLTGSDKWDSTGDKIKQLETWASLIRTKGAPTATDLYLGVDAAGLYLKDAEILKALDNRRVENGQINPMQLAEQNATFLGSFRRIGLDINVYSYQGSYQAANGADTYFLDANRAVLCSRAARTEMHYGMIENLKLGSFMGEQFPFVWVDDNGKAGHVTLESAPLVGFHQPDAFVSVAVK